MIKAILTTIAAVLALGLATAARADAAPSPTLDGETLVQVSASDVQSKCDVRFFGTSISWQASGAANGAYAGTFSTDGTASLYTYMNGGPTALTGLDATFTIASRAGTLKGALQRVDSRTTGTGGCNRTASDGWIAAAGVVYTAKLPDGTIDQGLVESSLVDNFANSRLSATFRSTARVADADLDGVADGVDDCPTTPNAEQHVRLHRPRG